MSSTDFAKTLAARARARAQMVAIEGRRVLQVAPLERSIESARRAAASVATTTARSRRGVQMPKI